MHNQKIQSIRGARRLSNYLITSFLVVGGIVFLVKGLGSFPAWNISVENKATEILFIPQGIIMLFYSFLAIFLGIYLALTIIWDIGGGYNEFDKRNGLIKIVRNGYPGLNRKLFLVYNIDDISHLELQIQEGINPRRTIFLCTTDKRKIPLTEIGSPKAISSLETEATELAQFLEINVQMTEL